MATQYDAEEARIKRQQMIAAALRDAGQPDQSMVSRTAGGYVIPISPWDTINRVASNALGGYVDSRTDKDTAALNALKQKDAGNWMSGLQAAQTPDELTPVKPSAGYVNPAASGAPMNPEDNTTFARQIAGAIKGNDTYNAAKAETDANDKARRVGYFMKGVQLGGAPAALGMDGLQKEMFPKPTEDYTLSEDQVRRSGKDNSVLAIGQPKVYKPDAESFVTTKIIDPSSPTGYKTIFRRDFDPKTMNEWEKPAGGMLGDLSPAQDAQAHKLAEMMAKYQIPPVPMGNRNPVNGAAMGYLKDMTDALGEEYSGAEFGARSKALKGFTGGKQGQAVTSFNVMIDHLNTLEDEYNKLDNGDVVVVNKWKNWAKQQFGASAPTTIEALKNNVRGEIVKAVTGGPGAKEDRTDALPTASISASATPAQMHDAVTGIKRLAGGQLKGKEREFMTTTGLGGARFRTYLSPAARGVLDALPDDNGVVAAPAAPAAASGATLRKKTIGGVGYHETAPGVWEHD